MVKKRTPKQTPVPETICLPSGYICEPLNDGKLIKDLTVSKDEAEYPYKISIEWGCFHRHYRYNTRQAYMKDLEVLLGLTKLNEKEKKEIWESLRSKNL